MKRKKFIVATLIFGIAPAWAQYESANKRAEPNYKKLNELVGKEFWIKANQNPNAIKKRFKNDLGSQLYRNTEFVVTRDLKFEVIDWELDSTKTPHLKIKFEDGKEAYIDVMMWDINKNVLEDVFDGAEYYDHVEYYFRGKPDEVLLEWQNRKAKQKAKSEAEYKAKGGVRIGMSKEQVLKSNWGKPVSINKNTTSSGVSEQWVYGDRNYLYFTNGVLTGIQN